MSQSFTCPKCGAPQDYKGGSAATIQCPYCETTLIVPPELRTAAPDLSAFGASDWSKHANALIRIKDLVAQNKKIEAIKVYRETFGTGLKESKDAVEAIERGQNVQIAQISLSSPDVSFGDFKITTSPDGIPVTRAPRVAGGLGGCIIAVLVLVIVGSILIPLLLAGADIFNALQPALLPTSTRVALNTPTRTPTNTPVPTATPTPGFASLINTFGNEGTAPGQLKDARHLAIDNKGNIFVGEYSGARIQRFNAQGEFQDQWIMDPKLPLRGLAADFRGNVYAVQNGIITQFNGATGEKIADLKYTAGGSGFDAVAALPDGGLLATWYEARSGFITTVEGHRDDLVRFDRNGKVTQVIQGVVSGQTGDPELDNQLAVDGQGNIYVLGGTFEDAVFKYSSGGKYLTRFGSRGDDPGQFRAPNAIAVDGKGRVYVGDGNRVHVFASDGRFLDMIQGIEGSAFGMAFDAKGHLWVVTYSKVYELMQNK